MTLTFGSLFAGIGGLALSWNWGYNTLMPRGGKPKVYPSSMVERVRQLYGAGHTQSEIAKMLDVSQKVIWNLMRRHNITARVAAKRDQTGDKNDSWKGDKACYQAKHLRVYRARGKPQLCEVCGTSDENKAYDWACVNGNHDDIDGYVRMCRSCHWRHDGTINNIHHMREVLNARG